MSEKLTLPRADIPIDREGEIQFSRDWYRFMSDLVQRVGGVTGTSTSELEASAFDDAGIEEVKAAFYRFGDDVGQAPAVQELMATTEALVDQVGQLQALVGELFKIINGFQQGTLQ